MILGNPRPFYGGEDVNKLRQFGELLAQLASAEVGLYVSPDERQVDLIRRLREKGLLKGEVDLEFRLSTN